MPKEIIGILMNVVILDRSVNWSDDVSVSGVYGRRDNGVSSQPYYELCYAMS